ncbi:MAG: MBL fold metallo-hydrolase RNA specificity domain-containing protein [Gemmatirosa sp.]
MPLRARVEMLNGYSAHGDRSELARWVEAVCATSPAPAAFRAQLTARGYHVEVPAPGGRGVV